MSELPKSAGFYWAKWRIPTDGTRDINEFVPSDRWEVVEVFVNQIDEDNPEHFMVAVSGVERGQALDGFVWGASVEAQRQERDDLAALVRQLIYRQSKALPLEHLLHSAGDYLTRKKLWPGPLRETANG